MSAEGGEEDFLEGPPDGLVQPSVVTSGGGEESGGEEEEGEEEVGSGEEGDAEDGGGGEDDGGDGEGDAAEEGEEEEGGGGEEGEVEAGDGEEVAGEPGADAEAEPYPDATPKDPDATPGEEKAEEGDGAAPAPTKKKAPAVKSKSSKFPFRTREERHRAKWAVRGSLATFRSFGSSEDEAYVSPSYGPGSEDTASTRDDVDDRIKELSSLAKGVGGLLDMEGARLSSLGIPVPDDNNIKYPAEQGVMTTLAGTGKPGFRDGLARHAKFYRPHGVAMTMWTPRTIRFGLEGLIYVADLGNHRLRRIDRLGNVTTVAGTGVPGHKDGPGRVAQFNEPADVTVDTNGNVFVADRQNHCVRKYDPITQEVSTFAGSTLPSFLDGGKGGAHFHLPRGITNDRFNNLYVTDYHNHRLRKITPARRISTVLGDGRPVREDGPTATARTVGPAGIAADSWGNLLFTDESNTLRKVKKDDVAFTLAGNSSQGVNDGFGLFASFNLPGGVCVDHVGTAFVADVRNHRVCQVEANGVVKTLAGGTVGDREGTLLEAQLNHPSGVAAGPGCVIVADQGNHKIRHVTVAHTVRWMVPEEEPPSDVDSVNTLEDWYLVYRAENMTTTDDGDSDDSKAGKRKTAKKK